MLAVPTPLDGAAAIVGALLIGGKPLDVLQNAVQMANVPLSMMNALFALFKGVGFIKTGQTPSTRGLALLALLGLHPIDAALTVASLGRSTGAADQILGELANQVRADASLRPRLDRIVDSFSNRALDPGATAWHDLYQAAYQYYGSAKARANFEQLVRQAVDMINSVSHFTDLQRRLTRAPYSTALRRVREAAQIAQHEAKVPDIFRPLVERIDSHA